MRLFVLLAAAIACAGQAPVARITIDTDRTFQTIDGFGVNFNGTYFRDSHKPMLDLLVKDLGATIFRLDPYGLSNWEAANDNDDPNRMNQEYYRHRYSTGYFEASWAAARYLNSLGIRPFMTLSGITPVWMNDTAPPPSHRVCRSLEALKKAGEEQPPYHLNPKMYDEFAEMAASMLLHARDRAEIAFEYFSPLNETDCYPREGPRVDPAEMPNALAALVKRLETENLGDIRLVVADQANASNDYIGPILERPDVMKHVSVLALHSYNENHEAIRKHAEAIRASKYPNTRIWLTEYGDLDVRDKSAENEWRKQCILANQRALRAINVGASAALFWDAFDNYHEHDRAVYYHGLLRYDGDHFSPKKRYYAAKQLYGFVPVGAVRIGADAEGSNIVVSAFRDGSSGAMVVVGVKDGGPNRVRIEVPKNGPASWEVHATTRTLDCIRIASPTVTAGGAVFDLPDEAVFTLVGR